MKLTEALQLISANVGTSESAAQGAQRELAEKQQLVHAARKRADQLFKQLQCAKDDLSNTRRLVEKAKASAQQARNNAQRLKRTQSRQIQRRV